MVRMKREPKKDQQFDMGAKTEQEESMNNRAISSVFSTLNDIDYDKDAVTKSMAPIHASVASTERDKRVSQTTHKKM